MKILILSFTDPSRDPRVKRQIQALGTQFSVTVAGIEAYENENISNIILNYKALSLWEKILSGLFVILGMPNLAYWIQVRHQWIFNRICIQGPIDIIICNDLEPLPISIRLKNRLGAKVIFDAHEWYEDQSRGSLRYILKSKLSRLILKKYSNKIDACTTVSNGLADLYFKNYKIKAQVVFNAPKLTDLIPSPTGEKIKLVHHGVANPNRQIEKMIEIMDHLDSRFTLDLFLVFGNLSYQKKITEICNRRQNVRLNPPWAPTEIIVNLNKFDIGFYFFLPTNINLSINLPNKFFEFIQGRLAVIAGPGGEMGHLIDKYGIGYTIKTTHALELAQKLNALTTVQVNNWKNNSNSAANALSFEKSELALIKLIMDLKGVC